jgi:hypothetical protein
MYYVVLIYLRSRHQLFAVLSVVGFVFSSSAFRFKGDEVGDGKVADAGNGVWVGDRSGDLALMCEGVKLADSGSGMLEGDSEASLPSTAADGGNGICDGEASATLTCNFVSCGDISFNGPRVHSHCRLLRFLRDSNVGFRRFCILSTSPMRSRMAAASIWRSLCAFRFFLRPDGCASVASMGVSSGSDSSDEERERSDRSSESDSSSSEDRSECLAMYIFV